MKSTLLKIISLIIVSVFGISLISYHTPAYAYTDVCNSGASTEIKKAAGCNGTKDELPKAIIGILNGIIAAAGLVAVIFVLIGGINYMTSAGDTTKLEKAKKTILYAVIGLAITVLSFAIVNFVIKNVIESGSSNQDSSQEEEQGGNNNLNPANTHKEETK